MAGMGSLCVVSGKARERREKPSEDDHGPTAPERRGCGDQRRGCVRLPQAVVARPVSIHVLSTATLEEALDGVCTDDDRELDDTDGEGDGPRDTYTPGA